MAFGNTLTTADALLKEYYSPDALEIALFEDHPLLGIIPKDEKATGREFVQPIVVSAGQGRAATFTTAQTHASKSGNVPFAFKVPYVSNHAVSNVDADTIAGTKSDVGAFVNEVTLIADVDLGNLVRDLAQSLYRTSDGNRGQIGSIGTPSGGVTNSQITLLSKRDIVLYEVGMQLDVAAAQSSGSTRAYGANGHGLYVISVDLDAGTFVVGTTANPATATAIAVTDSADGVPGSQANDFLYATGDRNKKMNGLMDWLPATVAANDSFNSVNRSANRVRLAGHYYDGTNGSSIASVLEAACARVKNTGGKLDTIIMDPIKFQDFSVELGAKAVLTDAMSTNAKVGYTGIKVTTAAGAATVLADMDCPSNRIFGINSSSWKLRSMGKIAGVWSEDGQKWLRASSDAGMEIRFYSRGCLVCSNPRDNVAINVLPSS